MAAAKRELLIQDVAAVIALAAHADDPNVIYSAVERIAAEALGWRLFTILRYVEAAHAVERVYSSDEKAYPVGGRKPLSKITASHGAMEKGEVFLAATKDGGAPGFLRSRAYLLAWRHRHPQCADSLCWSASRHHQHVR